MSDFERETTALLGEESTPDGRTVTLTTSPHWSIGSNANGGYVMAIAARAMAEAVDAPDPLSLTMHYLRPVVGGATTSVDVTVVRRGRTVSTLTAAIGQGDVVRCIATAAFGDLSNSAAAEWEPERPTIAPPDQCIHRSNLEQNIDLPILDRCDVRLDPDGAVAGTSDQAVVNGWIRLVDGADPGPMSLLVFADAFPPSVFPRRGVNGWVPTIELTVHLRRRPAPGWIQARFECDDLSGGRLIESGTLWDSSGAVVARSRQLGLLLE